MLFNRGNHLLIISHQLNAYLKESITRLSLKIDNERRVQFVINGNLGLLRLSLIFFALGFFIRRRFLRSGLSMKHVAHEIYRSANADADEQYQAQSDEYPFNEALLFFTRFLCGFILVLTYFFVLACHILTPLHIYPHRFSN